MKFVIEHVPDQYKTREISDKAIVENVGTLMFVLDYYKNHKMCNKAVENYAHPVKFIPNCYKTQRMCDDKCLFVC